MYGTSIQVDKTKLRYEKAIISFFSRKIHEWDYPGQGVQFVTHLFVT